MFRGAVQANKPSHKSTTIVIVDDDPDLLSELCDLIENDVCEVVPFSSSLSALSYIKCNRIEILISDYQMPTLDGIKFANMALEIFPNTLSIIMSGLPLDRTMIPDTWHFLRKPFDIRQIKIHIQARAQHPTL